MNKIQYQKLLEWSAVFYLYVMQLVAGIAFINNPRSMLFQRLQLETGFNYWHVVFSLACILGSMFCAIFLLLPKYENKRPRWKRTVYMLSSLPFAFYGVASAWYIITIQGSALSVIALGSIYFATWIIAGSVWRPKQTL